MNLNYKKIKVRNKFLLKEGSLKLNDTGCYIMKGANGCGKSLWLKRLHLDWMPYTVLVSQDNNAIISKASVIENISMSSDKNEIKDIMLQMENYGLTHLLHLNPCKMSGGEKRIISILRAFCSKKNIILMDEPSNDLDYQLMNRLLEMIKKFKTDKLIIMVTHDDRFEKVADGVIHFENKNIYVEHKLKEYNIERKTKTDACLKSSVEMLKYIAKFNIVSILLLILMAVIFIRFAYNFANMDKADQMELPNNQVNIFVAGSNMGMTAWQKGAFQAEIIENINSNKIWDVSKKIEEFQDSVNYNMDFEINLNSLLLLDDFEVYPLEYANSEQKAFCYPLWLYAKEEGYNGDLTSVETMPLFYNYSNSENINAIEFELQKYQYVINTIEHGKDYNGYEITYATVLLNDEMDIWDFLKQDEIKSLCKNANIYIQTNETIKLSNQILDYNNYRIFMYRIFQFAVLFSLIDIGYVILLTYAKRNSIQLFANYGVEQKQLKERFCKVLLGGQYVVIEWIIIAVAQYLFLRQADEKSIWMYMAVFILIVVQTATHQIKSRILNTAVKRAYNWKSR